MKTPRLHPLLAPWWANRPSAGGRICAGWLALLLGGAGWAGAQTPMITEFMAVNNGPLRDEDGDASDWIELHNPSDVAVNLEGYYLTDTAANLVKWRFPFHELPAGGFVVVFASGNDRLLTRPMHTNFKLESGGEYLALVMPDGLTVANHFAPLYPPQVNLYSYGLPMAEGFASNSVAAFLQATPGQTNGPAVDRGPNIDLATHQPSSPDADSDIHVQARVVPRSGGVGQVTLHYQIMFGATNTMPMWDDGQHGDGGVGDGVYGAVIAKGTGAPGEMVRWFVSAVDGSGVATRWPAPLTVTAGPEFFGTMIATNVATELPVFHLFARTNVFGRILGLSENYSVPVSVFNDGEFYDGVRIKIRGTGNFNKLPYRLEFHRDQPFRHRSGYPRIRETSLLGEEQDASYLSQHLSFWLLNQMGVPAPFHDPVRTHLNGAFHGLFFHNDVIDREMIERMGYAGDGAIYQDVGVVNTFLSGFGGFEKKSDPRQDYSDFRALAAAIGETNSPAMRQAALFDRFDVPQVVNYLASARWVAETDDIASNMSLYRDTFGDGLWRILPNDMDLSWGRRFNSAILDATNDLSAAHPLYGSASSASVVNGFNFFNRIYDVFITTPETREMLLRRERVVLDRWMGGSTPTTGVSSLESYIRQVTNRIANEAIMDRLKWGYSFGSVSNNLLPVGVSNLFARFIFPRRIHWSVTHCETNLSRPIGLAPTNNAGIPLPQPANAVLTVSRVESRPVSGSPAEEFLALTNPMPYAVDVSGWSLHGDARFEFREGTVVPRAGEIYVAASLSGFRARALEPRGGMGLFVVGPFAGRLSDQNGSLALRNREGQLVHTNSWVGPSSPTQAALRIVEVHYHPASVVGVDAIPSEQLEFVELLNTGSETLDLTRVRFTDGISFAFTNAAVSRLNPGERVVLVKDPVAFAWRYGTNLLMAGAYEGSLNDGGERLVLEEDGEVIQEFVYDAAWHPATDGPGFSLVFVDPAAPVGSAGTPAAWRPSGVEHGTPGAPDPDPLSVGDAVVLVNEVLANPEPPWEDSVELYNPGATAVDITGWFLTDDRDKPRKFRFPEGTVVGPGGFVAFDEHTFNSSGESGATAGFSFNALGDGLYVLSAAPDGRLTGYIHGFSFGVSETNTPFGRHVVSTGEEQFVPQLELTLGQSNSGPRVGPLVITEIYAPPWPFREDGYIELQNIGTTPLALGSAGIGGAWTLRAGVRFTFPTNLVIPVDGIIVVSGTHPLVAGDRDDFRRRHQIPDEALLLGPWTGSLESPGEPVVLTRPVSIEGGTAESVRETIGVVARGGAAVTGISAQRLNPRAFGDDPANWVVAGRTPGRPYVAGGLPPTVLESPSRVTLLSGDRLELRVRAEGGRPLFYQWRFNGADLAGATGDTVIVGSVTLGDAGTYTCVIANSAGVVETAEAIVTVHVGPSFLEVPADVAVRIPPDPAAAPSTNAVFRVTASTMNPPLTYQWRFNGEALAGVTQNFIEVTNVTLVHEGEYRCVITDLVGSATSPPARLVPLIAPRLVIPPHNQRVVTGATVTVSALVTGNPLPFSFEWRSNSTPLLTNVVASRTPYWIFTASPQLSTNTYRLVVRNQAQPLGIGSPLFSIATLADADADGLPDEYELAFSMDATNRLDAALDPDGDGMTSAAEYVAGTDPNDPLSVLRIEAPMVAGGAASVSFQAVSNRTYVVEGRNTADAGPWQVLSEVVATATNRWVTVEDAAANPGTPGPGQRVYRVGTPKR